MKACHNQQYLYLQYYSLCIDCLSELGSMRKLHSTADEKIEANVEIDDLEEAFSAYIRQ